MVRKTISLPDSMAAWIEKRVAEGQYNNDSEFFRDLVRSEKQRLEAEDQLRKLIQEGIDSGVSDKTPDQIWKEVKARHAAKETV